MRAKDEDEKIQREMLDIKRAVKRPKTSKQKGGGAIKLFSAVFTYFSPVYSNALTLNNIVFANACHPPKRIIEERTWSATCIERIT